MGNLSDMGLVSLSKEEAKMANGGIILANYDKMAEAFHWAYTEFKKGLDDGMNNR